MRKFALSAALLILTIPTHGAAAPPPPPVASVHCGPLFISPSGEPFRNAGGAPPCPLEAWFAQADTNHDGSLSRSEFRADAARFFTRLDRNADGVVDAEELQRYERELVPEILGRPSEALLSPIFELAQFGGGGPGGGQSPTGAGSMGGSLPPPGQPDQEHGPQGSSPDGASHFGLFDEPEPVASADLNFDGSITLTEFLTRASQRFDSLDPNGAGGLTLSQLQERMAVRGGDHGGGRRGRRSSQHPA